MLLRSALLGAAAAVALATPASAQRASTHVTSPRQSFEFSRGWLVRTGDDPGYAAPALDDRGWTRVTLPHAFNEAEAFARDVHHVSEGITWYRKHFRLPRNAPRGRALLEFQGVRQAADVWVNGTKVGFSENGVMAFGIDVTTALRPGDNVVAVRVDNHWDYRERATNSRFQWQDKNFYANYGGINKPVRLHLTGPVHQTLPLYSSLGTTGTYIWADAYDVPNAAATIHAESEVRNAGAAPATLTYGVILRDRAGREVARFDGAPQSVAPGGTATLSAARRVSGLHFWSWGYGYLYTVTGVLRDATGRVLDAVDTRTGFRATSFANGTVKLNHRVIQLKGYAQRTTNEWPAVGISIPPWISDLSNGLMTGSNANLVRWMHVTPSKQDVESADRIGLIQAMPAGDSEGDPTDRRWEQRVELMRDAIIYNRNNPSILFYEAGNKGIRDAHMADMLRLRERWDPHGGRAMGSREMLGSDAAMYGGEMLYINKSAGKPLWAHEYMRDEAARAFQDDHSVPFHKNAPDYNRNVESMAAENVRRWWDCYEQRPGGGDRSSAGGVKIGFTDSHSHFRGDNNYRRSGVVDAVRLRKDPWYVHRAMWDGWVDAGGHHVHVVGHWTYAPGTVKPVHVVTNGDSVELFLNGRSLGTGKRESGFLHTFPDVRYAPGTLKAVATFADGRTAEQELVTAGKPVAIKLTPITGPRGLVADGADLLLVDVEVVDARGRRVPTAFDPVSFALKGPAVWKGGIAQEGHSPEEKKASDNHVGATTLPVELGINRVLIRSTERAGRVRLTATAAGLRPATISVASRAAPEQNGLSRTFAEDFQPSDLSRGPTPAGPSFTPRLRSVPVAAVVTGSNAAEAANSRDDDETTSWSSDGTPAGAWIEYRFAQPESPTTLSLRLTGWRIRGYPIRVTLDGKVMYEGTTPRSLGYVTLPLAPATGRSLRVALTAPTADRDAFGNIVEVKNDRVAASVGADKVPAGWRLSLVEADILARVER